MMSGIAPVNSVQTAVKHKKPGLGHFIQDVFSTHPDRRNDGETARISAAAGILSGLFTLKGLFSFAFGEEKLLKEKIPNHALINRLKGFSHLNLSLLLGLTSKANYREWQAFRKLS
jgi:hypothetical protein